MDKKIGDLYTPETARRYGDVYGELGDSKKDEGEADNFFSSLIPLDLNGKTTLDLGSGNGRYSELLHKRGVARVIALDLSRSQLFDLKRRKEERDLERVEIIQGDIERIPVANKNIDYILSRFSVMYTNDLKRLFEQLSTLMTDDGEILIETNFVTILDPELVKAIQSEPVSLILRIGERSVEVKNYAHTLEDYLSAFENAGLSVETMKQFPADELSVDPAYPHSGVLIFQYVVFRLKKKK